MTQDTGGVDALAADGGIVRLRPVTLDDGPALTQLHAQASQASLRLRFLGVPGENAIAAEIARLTRAPSPNHDAVLAEHGGDVLGVCSVETITPGGDEGEFAVLVAESAHGRGIGTLLLEYLSARARARGIVRLVGEISATNSGMLRVAADLSGHADGHVDGGVVRMTIKTTVDDAVLDAADARNRVAERASLRPLLAPESIAVVGVGRQPGGIGHETFRSLREYGFAGGLYAVNPRADEIADARVYPSLRDVPAPIDLAVVVTPARDVAAVLADAREVGVGAVVLMSNGFGDDRDGTGPTSQTSVTRLARELGIRLVGPSSLGIVNTDATIRMAATFAPALPDHGGLALASQSGAIGVAVLDHARRTGVGVSSFVSLGDKADVSGNDLLAYWFDDPATTAVALYLESFGNPRRFARIARALARRKPVLTVFSGQSIMVNTLFAQAGVVRTDNLGELLDAARILTDQPHPAGDRLAVIGNASGVNKLLADAASAAGLRLVEFSPELGEQLGGHAVAVRNPLDLAPAAEATTYGHVLERVAASGEVDAIIVVAAATRANDAAGGLAEVARVADQLSDFPIAVVALGNATTEARLGQRGTPVFDLPERAANAMAKAAAYGMWRQEPLGGQPSLSNIDASGARASLRSALARGDGWQPYPRAADLLGRYGIAHVPTVTAVGARAVLTAAGRLGFPVVVKSADATLLHKSDVGAVKLRLDNPEDVASAYQEIGVAVGAAEPAVLVQPMASGELELVAGIVHDPLFGSLIMIGLGGTHAELFDDRAYGLTPLTDRDAARMWQSLRCAPLLSGYRGGAILSTEAVEELLLRLGRLAEDLPDVAELYLDPVIVGPGGLRVADAKLRLARSGAEPDPALRTLRRPD